uniref:Uncharacterized protein n=1 Tax=Arundo donax TaxID=35708 RepID=A0A0A9E9I4_ARUDO
MRLKQYNQNNVTLYPCTVLYPNRTSQGKYLNLNCQGALTY